MSWDSLPLDARREALRRALLDSALTKKADEPVKRKVFISYYHGDQTEVDAFIDLWTVKNKVFTPKALGVLFNDDIINSTKPDYVMSQVREKYLGDSSVTIVLMGQCTHSRRYVDWEIKSSLRQGETFTPNGLLGIVLPSCGKWAIPHPRFAANWKNDNQDCYARYHVAPTTVEQLRAMIEDAYSARTSRVKSIVNSADMMKYDGKCLICKVTH